METQRTSNQAKASCKYEEQVNAISDDEQPSVCKLRKNDQQSEQPD